MPKERKLAYLALLTTSVIWGFAPPIIKNSLNYVSPTVFLFFRFLFASIFFIIPLIIRLIKIKPSKKQLFQYLILGFIGTPLSLLILFLGLEKTSAIDGTIIGILTPIFVVIGGTLFLKEKISKFERIGIVLAIAGTVVTIIQPMLESGTTMVKNLEGNLLVLLGTIVWAIFTLLAKKLRHLDPFILSSSSFVTGFILMLPIVFVSGSTFYLPPSALIGILYMAILGSVVAYSTYTYGVSKIEASEATIFTYLQPIFAIPASVIFLKEKTSSFFFLGAILILIGVVLSEQRKTKKGIPPSKSE